MRFVLDTNILIKAFNNQSPDCIALVWRFYGDNKLGIVFDSGERIVETEYRKNLQHNEMYQKWFVAMSEGCQISYMSGKLNAKIKNKLKKLGFHEVTDQTFVAVALNSDKNIVSEDSDYGKGNEVRANYPEKQNILKYMTENLRLNVMDSIEGLNFIRQLDTQDIFNRI
jgi:hypothetical protein